MIQSKIIIKDALYYIMSKIIPAIAGIIFIVFFNKTAGISEYGNYSLLIYKVNLIVTFCFGWLNQSQLRYAGYESKEHKKKINYSKNLIFFQMILAFIILLLLFFDFKISKNEKLISLFCVLSIGLFTFFKTFFQAKLLPPIVFQINILQSLFYLLLPLLFFLNKTKIFSETFLLTTGLSFLLANLILLHKNKKFFDNLFNVNLNFKNIKKWLKFGIPVSIWSSLGMLLHFLDRFFIDKFCDLFELGVYSSISELLIRAFSFLIFPFTMALHPRITNLWNSKKKLESIQLIDRSLVILFIFLTLTLFVVLFFNSIIFKGLIYIIPELPSSSKDLIAPLIFTGIFWQLSFLTHKMIELNEKTYIMIIFILVSVVINLIGNIYFLPLNGIIATAYASLFSSLSYCILTSLYYIKEKSKII